MNTTDEATDKIEFQATVLDSDNQPLASGLIRLYTKLRLGTFWPQQVEDFAKTQARAAIVKNQSGYEWKANNFHPCSGPAHPKGSHIDHFEFDLI